MFLNEKGLSPTSIFVDMASNEQLGEDYLKINDRGTVPALVTDSGVVISEVVAIYHYLEAVHYEPPLLGINPEEKALIAEWDHRIEMELMIAIADTLRNGSKAFVKRALPGRLNIEQVPELVERGKLRIMAFLKVLDQQLSNHAYIAGERFSAADITAYVAIGFCAWVKISIPDALMNLTAWYEKVSKRESVIAMRE
jgi:glutathione S-transferase